MTVGYTLYWKRGSGTTAQANAAISHGTSMNIDTERYTVYHSPLRSCKWTLHIQNVQPNDEGYYSCYIYKTSPEIDTEHSNVMKLTTVQPIDTTVNPFEGCGPDAPLILSQFSKYLEKKLRNSSAPLRQGQYGQCHKYNFSKNR